MVAKIQKPKNYDLSKTYKKPDLGKESHESSCVFLRPGNLILSSF